MNVTTRRPKIRRNRGIAPMMLLSIAGSVLMLAIQFWPQIKGLFSSMSAKSPTQTESTAKASVGTPVQAPQQAQATAAPAGKNVVGLYKDYIDKHQQLQTMMTSPGATPRQREAAYREYQSAYGAYRGYGD